MSLKRQCEWAKGPSGPVQAAEGVTAECYDCGEAVTAVKEHKRKRDGIEHHVRSFFRHSSDSTCKGESWQHKAAKHRVATTAFHFYSSCMHCIQPCKQLIGGTAHEECMWCYDGHRHYLDVGFITSGHVTGAVEILHTHQVDEHKRARMTTAGLKWVEVEAERILEARAGDPVYCVSSSEEVCGRCKVKMSQSVAKARSDAVRVAALALDSCVQASKTALYYAQACKNANRSDGGYNFVHRCEACNECFPVDQGTLDVGVCFRYRSAGRRRDQRPTARSDNRNGQHGTALSCVQGSVQTRLSGLWSVYRYVAQGCQPTLSGVPFQPYNRSSR